MSDPKSERNYMSEYSQNFYKIRKNFWQLLYFVFSGKNDGMYFWLPFLRGSYLEGKEGWNILVYL